MKMHLKSKKKKKLCKKYIIFILLIVFIFIFLFCYKNANTYYLDYSSKEASIIVSKAISDAINEDVLSIVKDDDLYTIVRNKSDEIEMINYNSYLINKFLKKVDDSVTDNLKEEEKKEDNVSFYISLGSVFQNPILNDKGPKIPVKMKMIGSSLTSIKSKITDYGINNSMIEMYVHIEIKERVLLPSSSKDIKIANDIPISYKLIKGKIPSYNSDNKRSTGSEIFMTSVE